jgi:outer membrane protein
MRIALLTVLLLAACPLLRAAPPERLTLAEAEQRALRNSPAIRAAQLTALAAEYQPQQLAAARYPRVVGNLTGAGAPENSRLAAGGLNNPIIYSRFASGFSVNQLLVDFGRTSHLVESARLRSLAEHQRAETSRAEVLLEVRRAYFTALRSEAVLGVARQTVAARQLMVDQVTEMEKARLKSGLDRSFAEVSLAEAELLQAEAENERKAAYTRLSAVLGYSSPREFELSEEPFHIEPLTESELIGLALRNRPDLKARSLELDAANRFARAERALRYPEVSAMASAGWLPGHDSALRGRYGAAGVNVSLPFLNGGLYAAREAEARVRARAAQERARDLETSIARDVSIALLDVNTAAQRVELTARLLDQAGQALELAQARYELGLSSIVEFSQAQLARTSAAIQNATAKHHYQIQRAVLDYQVGK